mmetsp:Transcript_11546/g.35065  ORF Transcript_11546/g.35065 Transcript_11546/m.35065 type:complete len:234 (-) Transcript_11546:611-1312(-)
MGLRCSIVMLLMPNSNFPRPGPPRAGPAMMYEEPVDMPEDEPTAARSGFGLEALLATGTKPLRPGHTHADTAGGAAPAPPPPSPPSLAAAPLPLLLPTRGSGILQGHLKPGYFLAISGRKQEMHRPLLLAAAVVATFDDFGGAAAAAPAPAPAPGMGTERLLRQTQAAEKAECDPPTMATRGAPLALSSSRRSSSSPSSRSSASLVMSFLRCAADSRRGACCVPPVAMTTCFA